MIITGYLTLQINDAAFEKAAIQVAMDPIVLHFRKYFVSWKCSGILLVT